MPGQIISTPGQVHTCEGLPTPGDYLSATVWMCDDCQQKWVVVRGQGEDSMGYVAWRKLTESNRDGSDN